MFIKGERVICIINSRANLTVGKEYVVLRVTRWNGTGLTGMYEMVIKNDCGDEIDYEPQRFISLDEFRRIKLKQLNTNTDD